MVGRQTLFFVFFLSLATLNLSDKIVVEWEVGLKGECDANQMESLHFTPGMYNISESPASGSSGKSVIEVVLQEDIEESRTVNVAIYPSSLKKLVGYQADEQTRFLCCTPEVLNSSYTDIQGCNDADDIGHMIIPKENRTKSYPLMYVLIDSRDNLLYKTISQTGFYYIEITDCDCHSAPDPLLTNVRANVFWENPYGYLNGDIYYFYPFFGILAYNYLILAIVWAVLTFVHWDEILMIQNCIGGVILLGVVESFVWFVDYWSENNIGSSYGPVTMLAIFLDTSKRTVWRMLVLSVSMGYGVVKPTLGTDGFKVIFAGVLYFCFSGTFQSLEQLERRVNYHTTASGEDVVESIETMFIFPVAFLDTIFYWWIGVSLVRTIGQLTVRKQVAKLEMYKKFFIGLVISAIVSFFMIFYQLYVIGFVSEEEKWETVWIWPAFWNIIYFVLLVLVAYLWRPQENNTRYAYHKSEDDDLEEQGDGEPTEPASRLKNVQRRPDRHSPSTKSEVVEVEMMEMPIPTFTIGEFSDEEEEPAKLE